MRNLDLDAVFLDIDLAGFSGLDLAKTIQQEKPHLAIIFSTAFDEHAITAFKLNAVDYILKPFNEIDIERVFNKISNKNINNTILSSPNDKITIWLADKAVVLDVVIFYTSMLTIKKPSFIANMNVTKANRV